ncbi:BON domain-containing protein [Biformimicrobium ophioploci]|uniref:BON domain-containing protein n=1 Tax=Biformimicrobium ophioploci TaxID=3036711 RepID=A0ABQ6LWZ6_9GAMM|nr:BON domain-containing protein [Microbulbifer sp. NKW57]GMG86628.1 BON domain-containing protein [Microbulbifer sp. NKW57]
MMKARVIRFGIATFGAIMLAGCATIADLTNNGPIESDPGKRSLGAMIDDQAIETVVTVNIGKAHPDLKASNVDVTSFNGVVLLTGQVPSNDMRLLAGKTAAEVKNVRQVYNELNIQGGASVLSRSSDLWMTSKVKSVLLANKDIDSGRIKVVTEAGVVYLMGLLTRNEADRAAEATRGVGGVQKVVKAVEYID